MGCGISRFDPKEVVGATTNCPHNPPHSNHKSSNCFTGESKFNADHSSPNREAPGDQKMMKMKMDVQRGEAKEIDDPRMGTRTQTQFGDDSSDHGDGNDQNCREICRGGSPSFREYCIDSESRSRSMASEDGCEGDYCKWPTNEQTLNSEKERGLEDEIGKKERRGKGIRNALQRRTGGVTVTNFLSASRRQHHNTSFPSPQS